MLNITTKKLAQQSDKSTLFNLGVDLCNDFKKAAKDLDVEFNECANNVEAAIQKVKKAMIDTGEDFKVAEGRSTYKFGPEAKSVFDLLASRANGHFKVARVENTGVVFYTKKVWEQEPYVSIKEATETLKREAFKVSLLNDIKKGCEIGIRFLQESVGIKEAAETPKAPKPRGTLTGDLISSIKDVTVPPASKPPISKDFSSVGGIKTVGLEPEDIHATNSINAKVALFEALQDPVISKYPIPKIVEVYNMHSNSNPRLFSNASTLVPVLRQLLETPDTSLFDLELEGKIEKQQQERENFDQKGSKKDEY